MSVKGDMGVPPIIKNNNGITYNNNINAHARDNLDEESIIIANILKWWLNLTKIKRYHDLEAEQLAVIHILNATSWDIDEAKRLLECKREKKYHDENFVARYPSTILPDIIADLELLKPSKNGYHADSSGAF